VNKTITLVILLSLVLPASAATAAITSPKAGETWAGGTDREIAWTWSGSATVRLLLYKQSSGSLGIIKNKFPLSDGRCSWSVGVLKNGAAVPSGSDYSIRLVDTAGDVLIAKSPLFSISASSGTQLNMLTMTATILPPAGKAIQVSRPAKGDVWIPLKPFHVKWGWVNPNNDIFQCGFNPGCQGCFTEIWLMPAGSSSVQKILLAKDRCSVSSHTKGVTSFAGEYSGIVPYEAASGDYFVRTRLTNRPDFYGDRQVFEVRSTASSESGFVGPDPGQGQVDLWLQDVFIDSEGVIMMKIKNVGPFFEGYIGFSGHTCVMKEGSLNKEFFREDRLVFQNNEVKLVPLLTLGGFQFDSRPEAQGLYIPVNTLPISVFVKLSGRDEVNDSNNSISKVLCRLKDADIGTDGSLNLIFSPQKNIYIHRGTANSIHESQVKWVDTATFEADVSTRISNYGCKPKSFDIWLYADKLPGQLIFKGFPLAPGKRETLTQRVQVKLASRCGAHGLVLIADPQEHDNQPYPDSYMNNFINATLNVLCGGSVQGGG